MDARGIEKYDLHPLFFIGKNPRNTSLRRLRTMRNGTDFLANERIQKGGFSRIRSTDQSNVSNFWHVYKSKIIVFFLFFQVLFEIHFHELLLLFFKIFQLKAFFPKHVFPHLSHEKFSIKYLQKHPQYIILGHEQFVIERVIFGIYRTDSMMREKNILANQRYLMHYSSYV